ncbi:nuclease-related domain-containing protein [Nocardioides conyzicola]|uniref:NERD domain-containing protein n=1 Tax=Nocardioides conyzicola TaxID=1651781 RepID=A0ABP8X4I7_9ACTN
MTEAETQDETARALLALPSEWTVLEDVAWPGRKVADIDHVVVGPGGAFVVVSGRTGRSAVAAGTAAADALASGARLSRRTVHAVLCAAEPGDDQPSGVLVCTPETIVAMLLGRPRVLERDQLVAARATVTSVVRRGRGPRRTLTGGGKRRVRHIGSTGRLALFLLLTAATIAAVPWAAARYEQARAGNLPETPRVGETIWVAGTTTRPPLELTAERVEGPGRRYVVRLTVRNDGSESFAMDSLVASLGLDDLRAAASVGRSGSDLAGVRLEPGKERVVTYRFALPPDRAAETFSVAVSGRPTDEAHWVVS